MTMHIVNSLLIKSSPFRGVHWCNSKKRWRAEIEVRGRRRKIGRYANDTQAALAYDVAAIAFGVPERCNFEWNKT